MIGQKEELIRIRAYEIWERSGRPNSLHETHWYQAMREIDEEGKSSNGSATNGAAGETALETAPAPMGEKPPGPKRAKTGGRKKAS